MSTTTTIKPWQGTNFWTALVLLIGGLFVGFPAGDATGVVEALFASIAGIFAVREKIKDSKIDWSAWIKSKNTWNYLTTLFVALIPTIPTGLFQSLKEILEAAMGGNWQGIIAGLFSLGTILYYWLKPKS